MSETWYDVLGVEPTATEAEVKGAWRSLVTVLGPTDHRFASINEAASVLLDPQKRSAYDASLAPGEPATDAATAPTAAQATAVELPEATPEAPTSEATSDSTSTMTTTPGPSASVAPVVPVAPVVTVPPKRGVLDAVTRPIVLIATATLAVALVISTILVWTLHGDGSSAGGGAITTTRTIKLTDTNLKPITQQVQATESPNMRDAMTAAVSSLPQILCYDYRTLAASQANAKTLMTPTYAATYTQTMQSLIAPNATKQHTISTCDPALDVGVVRTTSDTVEVLVLIDVRTSFTGASVVAQNFADMTMTLSNGRWLVDDIGTAPIPK